MNVEQAQLLFHKVITSPSYQQNIEWGRPRSGHPEATVRAHIEELERNLELFKPRLSELDYWRLKILIHVHDTFKAESVSGVAITHPRSHASLARRFLAELLDCFGRIGVDPEEADLLHMIQYHDEPYALWKQVQYKGNVNPSRLSVLLSTIRDWNLFLAFCVIDGCTAGKQRDSLHWLFETVGPKVQSTFLASDIIPLETPTVS